MDDLLRINKNQYSIIYRIDSGFNTYNFIKKDIGYEMYFSKYKVNKKDLAKSITQDTTDYFTFYAFTLANLRFKSLAQQISKSNLLQNERIQKTYLWGQG